MSKNGEVVDYRTKVRFDDAASIKRFLGRVCNSLNNDDISTDKARALGYLCGVMLKAFEISDFEERLSKLEGIYEGGKAK